MALLPWLVLVRSRCICRIDYNSINGWFWSKGALIGSLSDPVITKKYIISDDNWKIAAGWFYANQESRIAK